MHHIAQLMGAFMMRQAAEQALHTMFQLRTGMYVNSHNPDKLLRYCVMFCHNLAAIFPRNNEKDERLFRLLQNAYVDGRYRDNYSITLPEPEIIKQMAGELSKVMKDLP